MRRGTAVTIAVVVAVAAAAVLIYRRGASGGEPEAGKIKTALVRRGPLKVTVAATGTVEPAFKVDVKSKASGAILEFPVEAGDFVGKGDLLCRLDPTDEERNVTLRAADVAMNEASVKQAKAALERAKVDDAIARRNAAASLERAKAELALAIAKEKRETDLAAQALSAPEAIEAARAALTAAEAGLVQAEAMHQSAVAGPLILVLKEADVELAEATLRMSKIGLEEATKRLDETKIHAPIAGRILTKAVERGHIIASGITSVSGGTTIATIADVSQLFVIAEVDEADVGRVAPKQAVAITADAFRDERFDGEVERVLPEGVEEANVTVFKVKIAVQSKRALELLLSRMTANVEVIVDERKDCLIVPAEAIRSRDGKLGVEVVKDDSGAGPREWRAIERGLTDGYDAEVLSGLKQGEVVIVSDGSEGKEGAAGGLGSLFRGGGRRR